MKVLYVCTSTDTGGAEISLYQLACACLEAGHQVRVISLKHAGAVAKRLQESGIEVVSLNLSNKFRLVETADVLSRLIQQIQDFQPDVVHASLFRAIQLCRIAKKYNYFRLITTPHYNLAEKSFFHRLIDRALKQNDNISCAESNTMAQFLIQKQKYPKENVRLIPNGVNTDIFQPSLEKRDFWRKKLGFSQEDIVFICTARLSLEKNHKLLLDSFEALKMRHSNIRLLLVGEGAEKVHLQEIVSQKKLEKEVLFIGEVENVNDFLSASDIFVLVSYIESLPISLLEAAASGLPAVVSKVGDMPLAVLHGKTGFVCNTKDSVLLSVLMAELTENNNLRKQMGQKARSHIKQNYSSPIKSYLNLYQEIQKFSRENKES